jgi:hypothetical protein
MHSSPLGHFLYFIFQVFHRDGLRLSPEFGMPARADAATAKSWIPGFHPKTSRLRAYPKPPPVLPGEGLRVAVQVDSVSALTLTLSRREKELSQNNNFIFYSCGKGSS